MGTSVNQRSPSTPSWLPLRGVLGNPRAPVELQSREIWRAASVDRNGNLTKDLTHPVVAIAATIARQVTSPAQAARKFDLVLTEASAKGLVFDIARRALIRAVASNNGVAGFAKEMFSETASYYVSRDLPSYIGSQERVGTSSEAIALKNRLRTIAAGVAGQVASDIVSKGRQLSEQATWKSFVTSVMDKLREGKQP